MVLIETPGKKGKFKSRVRAIIEFTDCFEYQNKKEFYDDINEHQVGKNSIWAWKDKAKWGWRIKVVKRLSPPVILKGKRRGIVFTREIEI